MSLVSRAREQMKFCPTMLGQPPASCASQHNGSTTGEGDVQAEDILLAAGEVTRSGTEGDSLKSLEHAESVTADHVSPAVDAALKENSARSA